VLSGKRVLINGAGEKRLKKVYLGNMVEGRIIK
jgi:hypothetical protein